MNIVERLAIESLWAREFAAQAFIVRVPFSIFPPLKHNGEGQSNLDWQVGRIPRGLVPRTASGVLRVTEARAPFPKVILLSEKDEPGALFVHSSPKGLDLRAVRSGGNNPVTRLLRARLIGSLGDSRMRFAWETVIIVTGDTTEEIMFPGDYPDKLDDQIRANQEVNP